MRGIKNVSANCYMNTALQALLNIGKYNNEIVQRYISNPTGYPNDLLKLYLRMLVSYHNKTSGAVSISQFLAEACKRDKYNRWASQADSISFL